MQADRALFMFRWNSGMCNGLYAISRDEDRGYFKPHVLKQAIRAEKDNALWRMRPDWTWTYSGKSPNERLTEPRFVTAI